MDASYAENETVLMEITITDSSFDNATTTSPLPESLNFVDSLVKALSVMIVSELGDKTFFLAAIMAMRWNKLTVFLAAISSLIVMTVVSALLGWGVTSIIPQIYTYYASIVLMFLFGIKMFWDAYRMKPNEAEEIRNDAENQINSRGSNVLMMSTTAVQARAQDHDEEVDVEASPAAAEQERLRQDDDCQVDNEESSAGRQAEDNVETRSRNLVLDLFRSIQCGGTSRHLDAAGAAAGATAGAAAPRAKVDVAAPLPTPVESSRFGKQCLKIFKTFVNTFGLIFLAEWGDRSQLATIVLASVNDVAGIMVGGILGHVICTGLAVLAGALIGSKISVRLVTIIGGCVFIGFAIASLIMGPETSSSPPSVDSL